MRTGPLGRGTSVIRHGAQAAPRLQMEGADDGLRRAKPIHGLFRGGVCRIGDEQRQFNLENNLQAHAVDCQY